MSDQSTAAAERSAGAPAATAEMTCCVCGKAVGASHAARVGPPLMQACSRACAGMKPFAKEMTDGR